MVKPRCLTRLLPKLVCVLKSQFLHVPNWQLVCVPNLVLVLFFTSAAPALADPSHPRLLALGADAFLQPQVVHSSGQGLLGEIDIHDVETYRSVDGHFDAGVYAVSGAHREEISDDYGVDEFMYFLEGSVTLTSVDGFALTVSAGQAVVIPKSWRGVWESPGYKKIYVIYSPDKPIE